MFGSKPAPGVPGGRAENSRYLVLYLYRHVTRYLYSTSTSCTLGTSTVQ
jgi:hypothetical protein